MFYICRYHFEKITHTEQILNQLPFIKSTLCWNIFDMYDIMSVNISAHSQLRNSPFRQQNARTVYSTYIEMKRSTKIHFKIWFNHFHKNTRKLNFLSLRAIYFLVENINIRLLLNFHSIPGYLFSLNTYLESRVYIGNAFGVIFIYRKLSLAVLGFWTQWFLYAIFSQGNEKWV